MPDSGNDNDGPSAADAPEPDAHGQAAYLLLESLIHRLVADSVITNAAAIEIVNVAVEVKTEIADELGDSARTLARSVGILRQLAVSLESDAPG